MPSTAVGLTFTQRVRTEFSRHCSFDSLLLSKKANRGPHLRRFSLGSKMEPRFMTISGPFRLHQGVRVRVIGGVGMGPRPRHHPTKK